MRKRIKESKNERYEIIKNDRDLIQFKNEQSWTFKVIPKTATINALVSLSLDPGTVDSDFIQVKYHKDQANDKDYSHEGLGFSFKKWQADNVVKYMDSNEVKHFEKEMYDRAFAMVKKSEQTTDLDLTTVTGRAILGVAGMIMTIVGWGLNVVESLGLKEAPVLDYMSLRR